MSDPKAPPGLRPSYDRARCLDCGACDAACPEGCFVWTDGADKRGRPAPALRGVDLRGCTGCLRCTEVCPVGALAAADAGSLEGAAGPPERPLSPPCPPPAPVVAPGEPDGPVELRCVRLRNLAAMPRRLAPPPAAPPGGGHVPALNVFLKGLGDDAILLFPPPGTWAPRTGTPRPLHPGIRIHEARGDAVSGPGARLGPPDGPAAAIPERSPFFVGAYRAGLFGAGDRAVLDAAAGGGPRIALEFACEDFPAAGGAPASIPLDFGLSYFFTACETQPEDLVEKAAKARYHARRGGFARGLILVASPASAGSRDARRGLRLLRAALGCRIFPLLEIEASSLRLTYEPSRARHLREEEAWLEVLGAGARSAPPDGAGAVAAFREEVSRSWERLRSAGGGASP